VTSPDATRRPKHAAGDGEVPSWWAALGRRRLAVALGSTFVAVPVVVLDNLPARDGAKASALEVSDVADEAALLQVAAADPAHTVVTVLAPAAPSSTTTTAPPETTTTTAAPETTTTTRPATTTTTTAPPPPPPPPPPPAAGGSESGQATWYEWRDGECAHKTLPRGTTVTITNLANGATATCVVTDRGPYGGNRIIDLDDDTFAQLAPLSTGVIEVTIRW
jgi:hypothetical protein